MTESLGTASFLILESRAQHQHTSQHITKKGALYNTLWRGGEEAFHYTPPQPKTPPQFSRRPPSPPSHAHHICLSLILMQCLAGCILLSGSPSLSRPEPCSHLAFPLASSHPSLREWSLPLLRQIRPQGLLTMPSRTPKSWKLGEKGSEIGITSKLLGDSQVY